MAGRIRGKVVEVTSSGDLVTDLTYSQLSSVDRSPETKVTVDDEHETLGIYASNHDQPAMTLIAILDENEPLRLHLVGDSASMMLGVRVGANVEVAW